MNLRSEQNKLIFVTRPSRMTSFNAKSALNEAIANRTAIHAEFSDDYMVKTAAAKKLPRESLVAVNESTKAEITDLIVKRLKEEREEKFEFLDGRVFTGPEAAQEVSRGTKIGEYFTELEKETLRIVQDAFLRGQI